MNRYRRPLSWWLYEIAAAACIAGGLGGVLAILYGLLS
jgi:hypothetical protein